MLTTPITFKIRWVQRMINSSKTECYITECHFKPKLRTYRSQTLKIHMQCYIWGVKDRVLPKVSGDKSSDFKQALQRGCSHEWMINQRTYILCPFCRSVLWGHSWYQFACPHRILIQLHVQESSLIVAVIHPFLSCRAILGPSVSLFLFVAASLGHLSSLNVVCLPETMDPGC